MVVIGCFFPKGLRVGDEVIEFGSVNTGNFQNLQNIASVVQHSEGVRYKCIVWLLFWFSSQTYFSVIIALHHNYVGVIV